MCDVLLEMATGHDKNKNGKACCKLVMCCARSPIAAMQCFCRVLRCVFRQFANTAYLYYTLQHHNKAREKACNICKGFYFFSGTQPYSLQEISRISILRHLGNDNSKLISKLPLPEPLLRFLDFYREPTEKVKRVVPRRKEKPLMMAVVLEGQRMTDSEQCSRQL